MMQAIRLPVVPIPGLVPDSLGNYLASLGLLRVLTRKWPQVRIAWRDEILQVVGGPATFDELLDELCQIAEQQAWSPYERKWTAAQKKSTKAKSGDELVQWRANASERELSIFDAHAVAAARVSFNPLLGSGGNAGKRAFSDGWQKAVTALSGAQPSNPRKNETKTQKAKRLEKDRKNIKEFGSQRRTELEAWLNGMPLSWMLEKLNAASWFSDANKLYNSGQNAYREGQVSPWAMALACEGLGFLSGSASRRLGAKVRTRGAFPFVTHALAPRGQGDVGHDLAEFWAPIWGRPMTAPEAQVLIARGRAEIFGEGARTPAAFAGAILHRGVDAGIQEFRRFVLARTTSANTFESRFEGSFHLPSESLQATEDSQSHELLVANVIDCVLSLIERLPADRDQKGQPRFVGLRGPIEKASVAFAASPRDPETAMNMLDAVATSLDRVDRNRSFRAAKVEWKPLPIAWLPTLFKDGQPPIEAQLGMALVSGFPQSLPFTLYRFGVEWKYQRFQHPEQAPARWTWGLGELAHTLGAVLVRRILDWEAEAKGDAGFVPARSVLPARSSDVHLWLEGNVDDDMLNRWLARLALFDWRYVPREVSALAVPDVGRMDSNGTLAVFGLLKPLFDLLPLTMRMNGRTRDLLERQSGARTPALARFLANALRSGQTDAAVRMAEGRYAMARTPLIHTGTTWRIADNVRLLAAMLFTVSGYSRSILIQPWLRPQRLTGATSHG